MGGWTGSVGGDEREEKINKKLQKVRNDQTK